MDRITASTVFIAIVEQGSMVAAGNTLNMSRSMVTRYLTEMENWANTRLLNRSTRRLSLTSAGERVLQQCYQLKEIEQEFESASLSTDQTPQGLLRISCSQFLGQDVLMPFINSYLSQYPKVSIDLHISNQAIDLIQERIDLAIRITNDLDPNIIARQLGQVQSVVCASKEYLHERGTPQHVEQLAIHNCLTYSYFGHSMWHFEHKEESSAVAVSGNFSTNDTVVLLQSALVGTGIALLPKYAAEPYIAKGQLDKLLTQYQPQTLGIYGIYRSRKNMPLTLRTFIDEMTNYFSSIAL